jgi:hypothetical protein
MHAKLMVRDTPLSEDATSGGNHTMQVPLFMYMLPVNVFLLVVGTWAAVVIDGATWDRNLATGLFAWATREYIWQGVWRRLTDPLVVDMIICAVYGFAW